MNVLHKVPVLWLCLALLLLALVPSVPADAGFVGCVLAKRSGDEAVQLKLTTDQDGEVTITIGDNVITFGVRAGEQLDTGLLKISGDVVEIELFSDGILTDTCTIRVWDIPYHYEGFCCDEIPPVVGVSALPTPNSKGWNKEIVTVSITAEDEEGGSGIAAIYYVVTGAVIRIGEDAFGFAEAGRIATCSFELDEDGTYELEFWAEDNAGNESEHGTLTVEIDSTPPLVELLPSGGTYTGSVTIEWRASDSLSSLESCRVYLNSSLISSTYTGSRTLDPGSYSVRIEATDCAGNLRPYSTQYTVVGSAYFDVIGLQVSPSELVVGATSTISCTIRNTGGKRDSQNIKLYIDGSQRDTRSLTLASGESHVVSFSYTFQHSGSYRVKISSDDDSENKTVTVLSPAQLEVSSRTGDFGEVDVGSSANQSFTITNRGEAVLEGRIQCSSGDCAAFSFSPSPFSLGKQETLRITVRFSPSQEKTYSVVIGIESNGGNASVTLEGEAIQDQSWEKTFGGERGDEGYSVQQTSDGGHILLGCTKSYGAGGWDFWLIKTDASGNKQWARTFGGSDYDEGHSVQQTSDGGYILLGGTYSYGAGAYDFWLIKTDAYGNEEWARTFGGSDPDYGTSVEQTSDGGYILLGYTRSYGAGSSDFWLIKTDAQGNKEWDGTFGGSDYDEGHSVQQTKDGGYILLGITESYGAGERDFWLIKTDAQGNRQWDKTFGGSDIDYSSSVQQTSDSGYILLGCTYSYGAGGGDFWLIKTDPQGNRQWDKTFGGSDSDYGTSVEQTSDGGYILLGFTTSYGAGSCDFWLIKTDAQGNKEWDGTFGGSRWDYGFSVQQTSDGGYILLGYTYSYGGAGEEDFWLIKYCPEE